MSDRALHSGIPTPKIHTLHTHTMTCSQGNKINGGREGGREGRGRERGREKEGDSGKVKSPGLHGIVCEVIDDDFTRLCFGGAVALKQLLIKCVEFNGRTVPECV